MKWAGNLLSYIASISVDLANLLLVIIHGLIQFWDVVLDIVFWFIPDGFRASFAVAIILTAYVVRAIRTKSDKKLNNWSAFQSWFLMIALILGSVDGFYMKTVHSFVILYLVIWYCNHSISRIQGTEDITSINTLKHYGLAVIYSGILISLYLALYFNLFPYFINALEGMKRFYISFNLYVFLTASLGDIFKALWWLMAYISERFLNGMNLAEIFGQDEKENEK